MKAILLSLVAFGSMALLALAEVKVDEEAFGKVLGGWKKRDNQAAEYPLSGTTYRTYKPEVTPTPDGGIFISVRIDHVRGWLSSDDHAILEITVNPKGVIASNIALQGRSISSEVILGTNEAGKQVGAVGTDRAVQIGTDLVADLSAKLLREKLVEAGRVSFPSVLRHNYNLLFQAIRLDGEPVLPPPPVATTVLPFTGPPAPGPPPVTPSGPEKPKETPPATTPASDNAPLEIKPYASPTTGSLPPNG
jgi:hypothetical protein